MEQRGSKRANRAPFVVHQQWPALSTIHRSPTRQTFPLFFCTPDADLIGGPCYYYARWIEISWWILYYSLILKIFVSFFEKEIFIFIAFRGIIEIFFVLFVREEDFSLSVDNRNIFQGERGGGENLLGWRIVLFFFFFSTLRGRSDRVLIDRERFDTLRRVDQKVALLEIQEINERVREISKDKCIYKLVTKIFIAEHNYRWNYSFT